MVVQPRHSGSKGLPGQTRLSQTLRLDDESWQVIYVGRRRTGRLGELSAADRLSEFRHPGRPARLYDIVQVALSTSRPSMQIGEVFDYCGGPVGISRRWNDKTLFTDVAMYSGWTRATNVLDQPVEGNAIKLAHGSQFRICVPKRLQGVERGSIRIPRSFEALPEEFSALAEPEISFVEVLHLLLGTVAQRYTFLAGKDCPGQSKPRSLLGLALCLRICQQSDTRLEHVSIAPNDLGLFIYFLSLRMAGQRL